MGKKRKDKKRKPKGKSLKLPVAGETIFGRIFDPRKVGDQGQLHIDRMYAQGGFVVVQMLNYKTNEMEKRMMTPEEASFRMASIAKTTPAEYMPSGLTDAVIKACMAAKRQTIDGENEFYKLNQANTVEEITEEIYREIAEARKNDPELDEEMRRVEAEAKKK
jgi:hypothetical protein